MIFARRLPFGGVMRKILVLVAALVALAACASPTPPVVAVPKTSNTIAIISAVPPVLRLEATGLLVFDNSLDIADVPDWHLESVALDAATRALSSRYHVVYTATDTQFGDAESRGSGDWAAGADLDADGLVQKYSRADTPVDFLVVLCPSAHSFPYDSYPYVFQYIGVSKLKDPILTFAPVAHTYLLVTVYDGKTLKKIAQTPNLLLSGASLPMPMNADQRNYPWELLRGFEWRDSWAKLTTDQQALIRDRITHLLTASLTYTLQTTLMAGGS